MMDMSNIEVWRRLVVGALSAGRSLAGALHIASLAMFALALSACSGDPKLDKVEMRGAPLSATVPTDEIVRLGTGFNSADSTLRAECASGKSEVLKYPSSEVFYQSDVSVDELLKTISGSASFSVKVGKFRASGATEFAKSSASSKKTINIVLIARYETAHDVMDPSSANLEISPGALGSDQAFSELCGDQVVTEATKGGMIGISVVITAETESDASTIRAAVRARAWKVQAASEIFQALSQTKGQYTVQIRGMQVGGDAAQLGRIIGGGGQEDAEAVRDCSSGDVVNACKEVLARAIEYGSSPERALEMEAAPATLALSTTPWKFFAPIAELDVDPEVLVARGRLNLLASQNVDCQKDSAELALYCSTVNEAILQAAGRLCFDAAVEAEAVEACVEASQQPWLDAHGFKLPVGMPANSCGTDLALNTSGAGYPNPLESNSGWGGGANAWEILAGKTSYTDTWAHGLAFSGGNGNYDGEACGVRQATVDFGEPRAINRVLAWHHGSEHVPTVYHVEYWNGLSWVNAGGTSSLRADLEAAAANGWGSIPTETIFSAVTASKVRFVIDTNCPITHGWLYSLQIYGPCGSASTD